MRLDHVTEEWLGELRRISIAHAPTLRAFLLGAMPIRQIAYGWDLGCSGCDYRYPVPIQTLRDALYEHRRHLNAELAREYRGWRNARREANAAERDRRRLQDQSAGAAPDSVTRLGREYGEV